MPNMPERLTRLRELGAALEEEFEGQAFNLVKRAGRSAVRLVQLVLRYLPGK